MLSDRFIKQNSVDPINARLAGKLKSCGLSAPVCGGQGSELQCTSGAHILDMVPGHGALPLGHGAHPVAQRLAKVLQGDHANLVQPWFSDQAADLARRLMGLAPIVVDQVNFTTTSAEAIEIALNSARLITGRLRIVAAVHGTHGKSVGALSVTHTNPINEFAELSGTVFVPFGDIDALDRALVADGDALAAVILEPVQSEGGARGAEPGYFEAVRALCDRHDILLIHDEQMTGVGRTGRFFASEWTGGAPDIIVLGEALGGGVIPMAACLLGPRAVTTSLEFQQMSSFAGCTYGAIAGHAMLDYLTAEGGEALRQIRSRGAQITAIHTQMQRRFPDLIADHRGWGLLHGLEFRENNDVVAGREGAFLGLARVGRQYPTLAAGHMLSNGVRVTPAVNCDNVLRLLPGYDLTEAGADRYSVALEAALEALNAEDTVRATKHVTGASHAAISQTGLEFPAPDPVGEISADEGRFGFIVHQLETDDLQNLDPLLRQVTREQRGLLTDLLGQFDEPILLSRARIRGKDGSSAVGDFILLPRSARQLLAMPQDEASDLVQKCVNLAVRRGARIVGLGGYTSIVTRGGARIDPLGRAVTTGNGFTIEAALMAADRAMSTLGRDQVSATAAIIGAAGSIGSGLVQMISARAARLYLFVNPATATEKSLRRLTKSLVGGLRAALDGELSTRPGSVLERALRRIDDQTDLTALAAELLQDPAFFVISDNCKRDLHHAEIIYSATSSTEKLIEPEDLRPKSVVCDLSRPGNISYRCREERDDVLVLDGGVIAFPGRPQLALGIPMPQGVAFACIAETVMLAMRKHYQNTSTGMAPSHREVNMLRQIAGETGFELAELRAFDRPIGRVDWARLIGDGSNRIAETPAFSRASAPATPQSVRPEDQVDLYDLLVGARARGADRENPALIDSDGRAQSWDDLDRAAGACAAHAEALGVGQGTRVVVAAPPGLAQFAAVTGLWRIGAVPVIIDTTLPRARLQEMIKISAAQLALCGGDGRARLEGLLPAHGIDGAASCSEAPPSQALPARQEAFVIFTSGSTGRPKAVPHSLHDLVNMAENYGRQIIAISPQDRAMVTSRLTYSYGFSVSMTCLYHGATLLLGGRSFNAASILDQIETQRATVLFSVPTIYGLLVQQAPRDLGSLRLCIAAGEPRSPFVDDAWERLSGVPIQDGLGTTEIMSFVLATPRDTRAGRSLGQVVPGFEIELRNARGTVAPQGEAGVAWVRGNSVTSGYLNNPEANAAQFRDGWYCTDDILRMDAQGEFHYLGRRTDLTKVGGVWMSPFATQSLLQDQPEIHECAVVFREHPEPLVRPYAFVVPAAGVQAGPELEHRLREIIAARYSKEQIPHRFFFLDALPRTGNGKVQRFALSAMVQDYLNLEPSN